MIKYLIYGFMITYFNTTYTKFRVEVDFEIFEENNSRILKCKKTEIFKDKNTKLEHGCSKSELNLDNYYFWQDSIEINYFVNRNVI